MAACVLDIMQPLSDSDDEGSDGDENVLSGDESDDGGQEIDEVSEIRRHITKALSNAVDCFPVDEARPSMGGEQADAEPPGTRSEVGIVAPRAADKNTIAL